MALPLSPRSESTLNIVPINTTNSPSKLKPGTPSKQLFGSDDGRSLANSRASSPFQTEVGTDLEQKENSPLPGMSTPTKMKKRKPQDFHVYDEDTGSLASLPPLPPSTVSPAFQDKLSVRSSSLSPSKVPLPPSSPFKEVPDQSVPQNLPIQVSSNENGRQDDLDENSIASDDTGFTAFSAIPDMTVFAKLGDRTPVRSGRSPKKGDQTPSAHLFMTPSTSRRQTSISSKPSCPTPKGMTNKDGDTTNLLLDFTQQFEGCQVGARSPPKSKTEPNLLQHLNNKRAPSPTKSSARTPGRQSMLNLLDFDLPPQPTPRSIPTITIRELESLKSQYLSEISSLKASLSGREAEVVSLKKAVSDAERRVGEAQESLREERSAREHAENLKVEWEKKGQEVETALRKFKEEFMAEEKEKEDLIQRLDEANRIRQEAELKAAEATRNASVAQSEFDGRSSNPDATDAMVAQRVAAQLDEKMENLARELHQVYKKKHEAKVASLKKNYEVRAEKKCAELQAKVDKLAKQNDDLQAVRESSLSIELPGGKKAAADAAETQAVVEEHKSQLKQHEATIAGLREELTSIQNGQATLVQDLERERVEKGELVAAVDEMLALQAEAPPGTPQRTAIVEDFRRSIGSTSRPGSTVGMSSLRTPAAAFGESRIGRAGTTGLQVRGSHSGKSSMRSNIERMGSGR